MSQESENSRESAYIELAYSAIKIFANDGTIDMNELNFLLGLALKDNQIDEDERRVLANIFDKAESTKLSAAVRWRIRDARRKHSI